MEARADAGLAYMLQYEHVAWYEDGAVRILDRRVYPTKVEYVTCRDHVAVMQAIPRYGHAVGQGRTPPQALGHGPRRVGVPRGKRRQSKWHICIRPPGQSQTPAQRPVRAWPSSATGA